MGRRFESCRGRQICIHIINALLAHLVEQRTCNAQVVSSNPTEGTIFNEVVMSNSLLKEVWRTAENAKDPNLTGFVNWPYKQQLYLAQKEIEKQLAQCSTFVGEEEWLAEMRAEGRVL